MEAPRLEKPQLPPLKKAKKLAALCRIMSQTDGESVPFVFTPEQEEIYELVRHHKHTILLKARQVGSSTISRFIVCLWAILNPGWKVGVFTDEEKKSFAFLDQIDAFLRSLGVVPMVRNRYQIVLRNGSQVTGHTATSRKGQNKESKTGRSYDFQAVLLSEFAFWPDQGAFGAMSASLGLKAPVLIESTSAGPGDRYWQIWTDHNSYAKKFFPVEGHQAYRADGVLEPDQLKLGQSLGFTDPRAMRWFFNQLRDKHQGDLISCLREYPQKAEHAFQTREGRWIKQTSEVTSHRDLHGFKIYRMPGENTTYRHHAQYEIGVDTAGGVGKDRSAVAVIDKTDGALCASYVDSKCTIDDLAEKVRQIYAVYRPETVTVEKNGIGLATVQALREMGVPVTEYNTDKAGQYRALLHAKNGVETGVLNGPIELAEECDSLHVDEHDRFAGKKDLCMAIGFAYVSMERNPFLPPAPKPEAETFQIKNYIGRKKGW